MLLEFQAYWEQELTRLVDAGGVIPVFVLLNFKTKFAVRQLLKLRGTKRGNSGSPLINGRPLYFQRLSNCCDGAEVPYNFLSEHAIGSYPMGAERVNDGIRGDDVPSSRMDDMGPRIKQLREAKGLSQAELGRRCGVTRAAVQKWENGDTKNIENATFLVLCHELGTDPAYLVWGPDRWPEDKPPPDPDTGSSGKFRVGGSRRRP